MQRRITILGLLLWLAATIHLSAQSVSMTPTMALVDNTAWCATGNCLTPLGSAAFSEVKAGFDGSLYALTPAGALYSYTNNAWAEAATALQKANGGKLTHISVGSAANVLALSSVCSGGNNVFVLNSAGTAWTPLASSPGCLSVAEIGPDGTIWGFTSAGQIYSWSGTAWTAQPGSLSNISNAGAGNVWGIAPSTSNSLAWSPGTSSFASSTLPFTPSPNLDAVSVTTSASVAMLDTSGNIWVSTDAGNTWSQIAGTATSLSGGAPTQLFVISSGIVNHVNLLVPQLTVTATASAPCLLVNLKQECEPELLTAKAFFGGLGGAHGTGGTSSTVGATEPATLTTSTAEVGTNCDLFYASVSVNCFDEEGDPFDYGCEPDQGVETSGVNPNDLPEGCSGGGEAPPFTVIKVGTATTGVIYNGKAAFLPGPSGKRIVACYVNQNCTPATTPPLCMGAANPNLGYIVEPQWGRSTSPATSTCTEYQSWEQAIPYIVYTEEVPGGEATFVKCTDNNLGVGDFSTAKFACTTAASAMGGGGADVERRLDEKFSF